MKLQAAYYDDRMKIQSQTDLEDFQSVYRKHNKMVRSVLFHICGARDLDDLTQDVFLRIWKGLPKFGFKSQLKTWVYRIAVNTAFDHCRKQKKLKQELALISEIPYNEGTEKRMMNQDLIQQGLTKLSEKHRAVFVLAYLEELSIIDIAAIVKISEGTVKSRLHYARQEFNRFLNRHGVTP